MENNNDNIFKETLDQVETQMLQLSDTVAQLRVIIESLMEENNKLRMSNMEIRDRLLKQIEQAEKEQADDDSSTGPQTSGRESLQGFYDEGIHVCHEFFGSRRSPDHQCLFCQEVIGRLIESEG